MYTEPHASNLSEFENDANPFAVRRNTIGRFFRYASSYIEASEEVVQTAERLVGRQGLSDKDALHVACAIAGACDWFLSTDDRLLRLKDDRIKMMNPTEFLLLWEKRNDE
jgi:predicted nucleic acid-binding protein